MDFACLILLLVPSDASAEDRIVNFDYDHRAVNGDLSYRTDLKPGQQFQVTIKNTCPQDFDYAMHGVPKAPLILRQTAPIPQLSTITEGPTIFDSQFGSYILLITRKHPTNNSCFEWVDASGEVKGPPDKALQALTFNEGGEWRHVALKGVTIIIAVNPIEWELGQDASLNFAPFTDRHFTTAVTSDQAKKQVIRDKDREAPGRWNTSTLTHIYWPGRNHGLALGFGATNSKFEYYVGYGAGIGPRTKRLLNVATGLVYTPLVQLPDGIHEGDLIANDSTALNNLPTQYAFRVFVAVTATLFHTNGTEGKPAAQP